MRLNPGTRLTNGKAPIVVVRLIAALAVAGLAGYVLVAAWISVPRQSTLRLDNYLHLKRLRFAIDTYRSSYTKLPQNWTELGKAGLLPEDFPRQDFHYVAGNEGILAVKTSPFRAVAEGEPWGGAGEIARNGIPEARLVLFSNGKIDFVDEVDFKRTYSNLIDRQGDR